MRTYKRSFPLVFVLFYIILFGSEITPEFSLNPEWVRSLENIPIDSATRSSVIVPFKIADHFGYFSPDGDISFSDKVLYNVAIDEDGFINYSSINNNLILRSSDGAISGTIAQPGYPLFLGSRRFILTPDVNSLIEIDLNGNELWRVSFSSLITDIAVNNSYVFVGSLNDGASLWGRRGEHLFRFGPESSRINSIYGVAVSEGGDNLLVVSGIDPQIVTILGKKSSQFKKLFSLKLNETIRHRIICSFSRDGKYAFIEGNEDLSIIDIRKKRIENIPVRGQLQAYDFKGENDLFYIASVDDEEIYFASYRLTGTRIFHFSLPGEKLFFKRNRSAIYFGAAGNLMKLLMVDR